MGICCQSLQGEGKLETILEEFQRKIGLTNCDFAYASRQLEVYAATKVIETVRVPILAHSLGVKIKAKSIPGSEELLRFLEVEGGWSQRRAAVLCTLCCAGSNTVKAGFLTKLYGTVGGGVLMSNLAELVTEAVHIALCIIPSGAKIYYQNQLPTDQMQILTSYCDKLEAAAEKVKTDLLLSAPPTTQSPPEMSTDIFEIKVISGSLRALCSATLLRRMAHIPQKHILLNS